MNFIKKLGRNGMQNINRIKYTKANWGKLYFTPLFFLILLFSNCLADNAKKTKDDKLINIIKNKLPVEIVKYMNEDETSYSEVKYSSIFNIKCIFTVGIYEDASMEIESRYNYFLTNKNCLFPLKYMDINTINMFLNLDKLKKSNNNDEYWRIFDLLYFSQNGVDYGIMEIKELQNDYQILIKNGNSFKYVISFVHPHTGINGFDPYTEKEILIGELIGDYTNGVKKLNIFPYKSKLGNALIKKLKN